MADRPRRLQDRTRAVASRSSGRHDGGRLCPLTGRVKPALPVRDLMRERLALTWCPDLSRSTTLKRDGRPKGETL